MKNVLMRIQETDKIAIEDTMWLYKEKEIIQNNQISFLKNATVSLVDKQENKNNLTKVLFLIRL